MNKLKNKEQLIYVSSAWNKIYELQKYYMRHPFEYIKYMEDILRIKLKWYQRILLLIPHDYRTDNQKKLDRAIKALKVKRKCKNY